MSENKHPELDFNNDGKVTEDEYQLRLTLEKAKDQSTIAKYALGAFVATMIIILIPGLVPEERLKILSDVFDMFFLSLASIVGAYMGFSAWLSKK